MRILNQAGLSGYAIKPVVRAHLLKMVCDAIEGREEPLFPAPSVDGEEKKPVKPARILVAEDSPDNRLLVQVYLKDSPYELTFEENGKAAVDRFAASDFDLILLDIQMPVTDGLAATRTIRARERERGIPPIPIIALTADASPQDIEKSRDAGCNFHLSKPISKFELLSAIEKYRVKMKPVQMAQRMSLEPIRIEIQQGLESIVPGYLEGRRKEIPELLELLATSNFSGLATLAHNLKGTGGMYGFPELTRLGAALEQSAKQEDSSALHIQITKVSNYVDRVQLIAKT